MSHMLSILWLEGNLWRVRKATDAQPCPKLCHNRFGVFGESMACGYFPAAAAVEYPHGPPRRGLDPSAGGQARRSIIHPTTTLLPNTRLICPLFFFFFTFLVLLSCTYTGRERRPNGPRVTCTAQLVLDFHNPDSACQSGAPLAQLHKTDFFSRGTTPCQAPLTSHAASPFFKSLSLALGHCITSHTSFSLFS